MTFDDICTFWNKNSLERNWETDKVTMEKQVANFRDYPDAVWVLQFLIHNSLCITHLQLKLFHINLVGPLCRGNKIHSSKTCRFDCVCRKIWSSAFEKSPSTKNKRFPCYSTTDSRKISGHLLRHIGIQYVTSWLLIKIRWKKPINNFGQYFIVK